MKRGCAAWRFPARPLIEWGRALSHAISPIPRLAATRRQRLYESVILRTLGATRDAAACPFAVGCACLGAALLSWIVLRYVLDTPWTFEPAPLLLGVALSSLLALAVGFLATFRLLGHKPLPVLRTE